MYLTYWRIHLSWRYILHPSILKVWSLSCPQDLKNYLHAHRDTLMRKHVPTYTSTHRIYINFHIAQKRKKKSPNLPHVDSISIYSYILCTFFFSCHRQHVTDRNCQERGDQHKYFSFYISVLKGAKCWWKKFEEQQGPAGGRNFPRSQSLFNALQTTDETPVAAEGTLEVSTAVQSAPQITASISRKRWWVIVAG